MEHNLYGLEIDKRAYQLAYFAVMMKARQYDRRFFSRGIAPQLYCPTGYPEGAEFGSLLLVNDLEDRPQENVDRHLFSGNFAEELNRWNFRRLLAQKYDVVCTNPPYMAVSNACVKLNEYIKKNFADSKADLFAAFIERCGQLLKCNGYQAMITQHAWMFLSSFEKLREKIQLVDIVNMAHLGARAFEEIGGEVVQTTSFVIRKSHITDFKGVYCRLIEPTTQQSKEDMFLAGENRYISAQKNFSKIPGSPVSYWVSERFINVFIQFPLLGDISYPKQGLATSDNDRYLRFWFEVVLNNIEFQCVGSSQSKDISAMWYPYCKGGMFRKWYGNREYVINWRNNGQDLKINPKSVIRNPDTYFLSGMSYSDVSTGDFGLRYYGTGFVYDSCGPMLFSSKKCSDENILGVLNSVVINSLYKIVCPTIHFTQSAVAKAPIALTSDEKIYGLVKQNINISKRDWDSYETSWDFKKHPLI